MITLKPEIMVRLRNYLHDTIRPDMWEDVWSRSAEDIWITVEQRINITLTYSGEYDDRHCWIGSVE